LRDQRITSNCGHWRSVLKSLGFLTGPFWFVYAVV
jgi:hypothetical protein